MQPLPPLLLSLQLIRERRFRLYDQGSRAANLQAYGQDEPLDVAGHYHLLQVRLACLAMIAGQMGLCAVYFVINQAVEAVCMPLREWRGSC
jgi:hypothetical protein